MRFGTKVVAATIALGTVCTFTACKKGNEQADTTGTAMTPADSSNPNAVNNASTSAPASTATMTDAEIFPMLAAANQGEVDAGKMAATKATNADVKAFAKMMVTDHTKMLNAGNALAKTLNVTPKPMADDSIKTANQTLATALQSAAKGTTFDTTYVNAQVAGHQATLDFLNRAEDQATNQQLKDLIKGAIPTVQAHLDHIKDIQSKMSH